MAFRDPVIIGNRLRLDFSKVNIAEFERARREFHSTLQQEFFASYRIQNVETYAVRRGDNISTIAQAILFSDLAGETIQSGAGFQSNPDRAADSFPAARES